MPKRTLKVLANPYAAIDHEGIPCGAFPSDHEHVPIRQHHVGARVDREATKVDQHPDVSKIPVLGEDTLRSLPQTTRWLFDAEPTELPYSQHYAYGLRSGDLIPCDAFSAKVAGQPVLRDPFLVLAEKRLDAIERYAAEHLEEPEPPFVADPSLDPYAELSPVCAEIAKAREAAKADAQAKAAVAEKKFAAVAKVAPVSPIEQAKKALAEEQKRLAPKPPAPPDADKTTKG